MRLFTEAPAQRGLFRFMRPGLVDGLPFVQMRTSGLAAFTAAVIAALSSAAPSVASPFAAVVASGVFGGAAWTLSASDSPDGHVCVTMALPHHGGRASECGSILGPQAGRAHGITYLSHVGAPAPNWIVGPVLARAKTVVITLANGDKLTAKTIAAPTPLTAKIGFYAAQLPCPVRPTRVTGFDASHRAVANLTIRLLPLRGKTRC
jgi:hypothetical protein